MRKNQINPTPPVALDDSPAHRVPAGDALPPDAPRRSTQAAREVRRNSALRQARTCYHHLAGIAGVELLEQLLDRGWLEPEESQDSRTSYRPTALGLKEFQQRDVEAIPATDSRRRFAYGCLDWTERRPHLGGALGALLMDALNAQGAARRQQGTRVVLLGSNFADWLEQPVQPG